MSWRDFIVKVFQTRVTKTLNPLNLSLVKKAKSLLES